MHIVLGGSRKQLSPKWARVVLLGMGVLFFLVGGGLTIAGAINLVNAGKSQDWPTVDGVIKTSEVESHRGSGSDDSTTYHAQILYEYTVDGTLYSGNKVSFGDYGSSNSGHARQVCNKYPAGKTVAVHYDPADPYKAILEPGYSWSTFMMPGIGAIFALAGAGMFVGSFFIRRSTPEADAASQESGAGSPPSGDSRPGTPANPYRDTRQ